MWKRYRGIWLAFVGVALVAAAPGRDADELTRRGNAAFARGDYARAAGLFERAEERTTDPGRVAFNKAVALHAAEKLGEAESHYWLCLGDAGERIQQFLRKTPAKDLPKRLRDAAGPRLPRVLYNLGNCLVQRSQATDPDLLVEAVVLFDHCVRLKPDDARLVADARHNGELARELLRLCPRPPKKDQSANESQEDPKKQQPRENPGGNPSEQGGDGGQEEGGNQRSEQSPDARDSATATEERTPGKGNLGTLPDTDELAALSPEDAAAHLRQQMQRILGEMAEHRREAGKSISRDVLDW
jgi:tetratricopeptide (TPR) repeat protein